MTGFWIPNLGITIHCVRISRSPWAPSRVLTNAQKRSYTPNWTSFTVSGGHMAKLITPKLPSSRYSRTTINRAERYRSRILMTFYKHSFLAMGRIIREFRTLQAVFSTALDSVPLQFECRISLKNNFCNTCYIF